jgi:threonine dehydratase
VLVPVGGGGLIAGIASYFAGTTRVIGVEPDGAPTLVRARAAGAPVDAPAGSIAVEALGGTVDVVAWVGDWTVRVA